MKNCEECGHPEHIGICEEFDTCGMFSSSCMCIEPSEEDNLPEIEDNDRGDW